MNMRLPLLLALGVAVRAVAGAPAAADQAPRPTEARPLLIGNWADPTVLKDGSDYYMTHSSFEFQPGLLVWHSKDMRTWRPISRAVVNQPGSIWAPELIKHGGKYYIYYPAAGKNFVVTADSPHGPWTEARAVGVGLIDPGHVVGPDGKRYLHLSGGNAVELSNDGLAATGKPARVYEGWPIPPDWFIECFCLESPKITVRGGWYYLTSAQGGTAGVSTSHMVVSARSRQPLGPWENSPHNPILRTWSRDEAWWSKGHGTLVEGPGGQWYCILHGYMNGYRSLGRCTLIEPIEWTGDAWFKVPARWPVGWEGTPKIEMPMSDAFDGPQLGLQWQFFQRYDAKRFTLGDGALALKGAGANPGESFPLCVMPLHRAYEIQTEVEMEGEGAAGLMLFFSPKAYLGLSVDAAGKVVPVHKAFDRFGRSPQTKQGARRVALRIVNNKQDVMAYCRDASGRWVVAASAQEISGADHNTLGGWHAVRPALFACGAGQARFHSFTYRPLE